MQKNSYPLTRLYQYIVVFVLVGFLLSFAKTLFIPMFFALLVAIVLHPISKKLESFGVSKPLAIVICLLLVSLLIVALLSLLYWQINLFQKEAPALLIVLEKVLGDIQLWLHEQFNIETDLQNNWRNKVVVLFTGNLSGTLSALVNSFFIFFMVPIYTVLFMYHRKIFVQFLTEITPVEHHLQLHRIVTETIHTYSQYIKGMVFVYMIVGMLNSLGLYLIGVDHALLYGMICAVMTIIPYLGTIISSLLPISVIWLQTGNIWYPVAVICLFIFVQYLEANIIFPKVVGTQLKVSTFAVLVAVVAGGILWGISGMVLFIPFVAILKIATDHIPEWKALNLLLSRK